MAQASRMKIKSRSVVAESGCGGGFIKKHCTPPRPSGFKKQTRAPRPVLSTKTMTISYYLFMVIVFGCQRPNRFSCVHILTRTQSTQKPKIPPILLSASLPECTPTALFCGRGTTLESTAAVEGGGGPEQERVTLVASCATASAAPAPTYYHRNNIHTHSG